MANPFEYLTSINSTKKNMMRDSENDVLAEKGYEPWLVNKGLSYFPDTILHANLMNQYPHLDKRPQYECLINSIRPKKRFSKWVKSASDEELDLVCEYYECNKIIARDYLSLLSSEELDTIKQRLDTGGIKK
tara:strand:- start:1302 stop:1697 length:396 start_codon:yes stop_codon:yes gene_type:complete